MTVITATELQGKTGTMIDKALTGPVEVTRSGRPVVVLLSFEEYERLTALEDAYWGEMANMAVKTDSASNEDIRMLLERLG